MRTLLLNEPLRIGTCAVAGEEAHHGRTVLRLVAGDAVRIADGQGREATAEVLAVDRHVLRLRVDTVTEVPPAAAELLTIAVAPPKGDRFTDMVRSLTELGVGAILPLVCARGERIPSLDRAHRVAAEALKQCRRGCLPQIGPVVEFATLATLTGDRIVLDRAGTSAQPAAARPTVLIIGPEGGFTEDERNRLRADGTQMVRLASSILRIETAAVAAAAVWTAAWETK